MPQASPITAGLRRRWQLLGFEPNEWAFENLWTCSARFVIGTTGRQVGKTSEAAMRIDQGMNSEPHELDRTGDPIPYVGVLGSTYEKAELSVSKYIEALTKTFGTDAYRLNQNRHELNIRDAAAGKVGAKLKWLSAEEAYNTVGFTFSKVVVDEAQAIPDEVFNKFRPTWDVRYASADIFGTPDITTYQTWFQGMWTSGQDPLDEKYHSFSVASWEAPWMSMETILDAKSRMPENEFRRLYGGEWVEDAGLVFTGVEAALLHESMVPKFEPKRRYLMAVDLAAYDDFNVVLVGDAATRTVVHKERWNLTDPLVTYDRLEEVWHRYGRPWVYADETGLGGIAMVRELRNRGMRVSGTTFSNTNKMEMVRQLASDLQHRRIMFPASWDDVRRELGSFVYARTPAGKLTANARVGSHDDTVTALMLLDAAFRAKAERSGSLQGNYLTSSTPIWLPEGATLVV